MRKYVASDESALLTYAPECFYDLKTFFTCVPVLYPLSDEATAACLGIFDDPMKGFLKSIAAIDCIAEIRANSGSLHAFVNRFFRWFDAFRIIKFLNHASGHYPQIPVKNAVMESLKDKAISFTSGDPSAIELLTILRNMERSRR
jgi:hypothetical protein